MRLNEGNHTCTLMQARLAIAARMVGLARSKWDSLHHVRPYMILFELSSRFGVEGVRILLPRLLTSFIFRAKSR
jgi:hypothetical protein